MAAIRAALVKGRSSGDEVYAAADEAAQQLRERICQLHQSQKQAASAGEAGISPARVMYNSYSFGLRLSPCVHTFSQKPIHLL